MRESDFGRVHIKSIIDRHLLDAGYDPYQGEMAKRVDAVSRAVQEILREYTRSVSPGLIKPTQHGEGGSTEA